jgi:dTDP-4-amino-4,6-dideoxygalactose transaminase
MDGLSDLGIPMIEDLSQGLGGNFGTRRCGSFGDFVVVSLDSEGIITGGMGGLVLARERNGLKILKSMSVREHHLLSDFNASLGLAQLKEIESFIESRGEIAKVFSRSILRSNHKTLAQKGDCDNVHFSFPVILNSGFKEVGQYVRKRNIDVKHAFQDVVLTGIDGNGAYPNSKNLVPRCILFPLYPVLGKNNVEMISKVISTLP